MTFGVCATARQDLALWLLETLLSYQLQSFPVREDILTYVDYPILNPSSYIFLTYYTILSYTLWHGRGSLPLQPMVGRGKD